MADEARIAPGERLRKAEAEADPGRARLREGVPARALMELGVARPVGVARHERTPARTGPRHGSRERAWETRVGTVALRVPRVPRVPRVRDSGTFPSP